MTTTVTVSAHCDPKTTEVVVVRGNDPVITMQDGETQDFSVYDDISLSVAETPKT